MLASGYIAISVLIIKIRRIRIGGIFRISRRSKMRYYANFRRVRSIL